MTAIAKGVDVTCLCGRTRGRINTARPSNASLPGAEPFPPCVCGCTYVVVLAGFAFGETVASRPFRNGDGWDVVVVARRPSSVP